MESEHAGEREMPFGEPESPARDAWRKLFDGPTRPTAREIEAWRREIDAAMERADLAIERCDIDQLLQILRDCPAFSQSPSADDLLRHVIKGNQHEALDALLQSGIPADLIDEGGTTPLMDAAGEGRLEMARRLLEAGADPNVLPEHHSRKIDPEAYGMCALYFALCRDDRAMMDLLSPVTRPEVRALAYQAHQRWQEAEARSNGAKIAQTEAEET